MNNQIVLSFPTMNGWKYLNGNPVSNITSFNNNGTLVNSLYENVIFKTNLGNNFPIFIKLKFINYIDVDWTDVSLSFIILLPQLNDKPIAYEIYHYKRNFISTNKAIKELFKKYVKQYIESDLFNKYIKDQKVFKNIDNYKIINPQVINYFKTIGCQQEINHLQNLHFEQYYNKL